MGIDLAKLEAKAERKTRRWRRKALQPVKWLAYETGQTRLVPWPDRMYIESTNLCNLGCIMCPTGRKEITRPKGFIDYDLFKRIVDEMAPHVHATTLHIWGEPLMHPRIFDMIAYCRANGLRSEISTNSTLLDERKAKKILDTGLDAIYLCLDGMRPETYEAIRVNADYKRTNQNIRRFIDMKIASGLKRPYINLQMIQMQKTAPEVEEFVKVWSIPGVDNINVKPFDSWAGQDQNISLLSTEQPVLPVKRYPCPNLWYHVHIYWDGNLAMCDRDYNSLFPLGNVKDGVMKAWNGPEMQELRRLHVTNQVGGVSPCNTCTEWAWWKPTPFQSHGNYAANVLETNGSANGGGNGSTRVTRNNGNGNSSSVLSSQ
jgi:hypothetical protein